MTAVTSTLLVARDDIADVRWQESDRPPLEPGQVRLAVELFGLSANNATYAAIGDSMRYWEFFPTGDPARGCVPVWGYAAVVESACDEVAAGTRVFGYLPFATDVVVTPTRVRDGGFAAGDAHRAELAAAYNAYTIVDRPSGEQPEREAYEALLRPLFVTSLLIADWLSDEEFMGAETLLVSSASSKTAYGIAHALAGLPAGTRPEVVGLTSTAHVQATRDLGLYDRVLAYDEITQLDADRPTVYVDISGSARIRDAVHEHCAGLRHDCAVGLTHRDSVSGGGSGAGAGRSRPGPRPVFFFAPTEFARQAERRGRAEHARHVDEALAGFVDRVADPADPLMTLRWTEGREAAADAWRDVVAGRTAPSDGVAVRL